ncbi:MAG TPA: hypothetical protein V6D17_10620 [Candidatus Obscuribacterales bacterium]
MAQVVIKNHTYELRTLVIGSFMLTAIGVSLGMGIYLVTHESSETSKEISTHPDMALVSGMRKALPMHRGQVPVYPIEAFGRPVGAPQALRAIPQQPDQAQGPAQAPANKPLTDAHPVRLESQSTTHESHFGAAEAAPHTVQPVVPPPPPVTTVQPPPFAYPSMVAGQFQPMAPHQYPQPMAVYGNRSSYPMAIVTMSGNRIRTITNR